MKSDFVLLEHSNTFSELSTNSLALISEETSEGPAYSRMGTC